MNFFVSSDGDIHEAKNPADRRGEFHMYLKRLCAQVYLYMHFSCDQQLHALPCYPSCTQQAVCCWQKSALCTQKSCNLNKWMKLKGSYMQIKNPPNAPPPQKTMQNLTTQMLQKKKKTGEGSACGLNEWKNSFVILRHCWTDKSRYKFWFRRWETGGWLRQTGVCLTHFTLSSIQRNDFKRQDLKRKKYKFKGIFTVWIRTHYHNCKHGWAVCPNDQDLWNISKTKPRCGWLYCICYIQEITIICAMLQFYTPLDEMAL